MELPAEVLIHNEIVGMKGTKGRLLTISPQGYYEVNVKFGERLHRVLMPVDRTVLISQEAEETLEAAGVEIER